MFETLVKMRRPLQQCAASSHTPLRIAMVSARCFPHMGGIEAHVHEVSLRLLNFGHEVTVLTTDPAGKLRRDEMARGVRIIRVPAWPPNPDYCLAPAIYREIKSGSFDVVHIQGYNTLVPPIGMLAAIRKRVPFVITYHSGGHSSPLRKVIRPFQWRALTPLVRKASRHVGVSEFEADFFSMKMGVPRSSFVVIPNGGQLPLAPPVDAPSKRGKLMVSVGRLERYKGHHKAIEALHKLQWRMPDVHLMVLGSGPYEEELRKLVKKLRLSHKVKIGSIPPSERQSIAALLSSADLVVLLSEYEAHPVAVMEALALGRKVLTSDTSGFSELAQKGLTQTVSLKSAPIEIASAMADALQAPAESIEFALPTWDDCAEKLNEVYKAVARPVV
jgi:glycosyltransferase involved in cell wall biosynthesis